MPAGSPNIYLRRVGPIRVFGQKKGIETVSAVAHCTIQPTCEAALVSREGAGMAGPVSQPLIP